MGHLQAQPRCIAGAWGVAREAATEQRGGDGGRRGRSGRPPRLLIQRAAGGWQKRTRLGPPVASSATDGDDACDHAEPQSEACSQCPSSGTPAGARHVHDIGVVCAQRQQPDCLRLSATLVARRLRRTIALRRPPSGACALRVHAQVSVRTDSADSIIIAMAMPKCTRSRTLGRDEPALGKPAP